MKRIEEGIEKLLETGTAGMRNNTATAEEIKRAASRILRNLKNGENIEGGTDRADAERFNISGVRARRA